jgi:hypothetical protein
MYVWVRATVDWDDAAVFDAAVPEKFRPTVELWDATFTMPFRLFRARLREIAARSWLEAGLDVCVDWEDVPDGELFLPSDDDDWFAPDIVGELERRWAGSTFGCSWTSTFVEVPLHWRHRYGKLARTVLPVPPKNWCTTNNYALVLDTRALEPATWHRRASQQMRSEPRFDVRLSCMNRSLASQTSVFYAVTPERLVARWERYRKLYRNEKHAPAWCGPYIQAMRELMTEIEPA